MSTSRRPLWIAAVLLFLVAIAAFFLFQRCSPRAILSAPEQAVQGMELIVEWTGPNQPSDYITIVAKELPDGQYQNYTNTSKGTPLTVLVPIEPGAAEIRYMSKEGAKVLARRPLTITPAEVTLNAPEKILQGVSFMIEWKGPDNGGDYLTIVPKDLPDGQYQNYINTSGGSPAKLTAPIEPDECEIRYMSGQGAKVLARRPISVAAAEVSVNGPESCIAGSEITVEWIGPNNQGDYITIVPKDLPDGRYGNYKNTSAGTPLPLTAPIVPGEAELRYMTGQGAKVLARRPIRVEAATITLEAPPQAAAGSEVSITWKGPNNAGDYLTIVPKELPDGQYREYATTAKGSPLKIKAPAESGPGEIRYMSGQGAQVLQRLPLEVIKE